MTREPNNSGDAMDWESTTWEGHRRRQINRWAGLTLEEILEAQESMAELAREIAAAPIQPATKPGK